MTLYGGNDDTLRVRNDSLIGGKGDDDYGLMRATTFSWRGG